MSDNEWYTSKEAAELLEVSLETIRRRLRSGELEGKKEGNMWRVRLNGNHTTPQQMSEDTTTDTTTDVVELKYDNKLLKEKNQTLQEKIEMLQEQIADKQEQIRALENDKGFLLDQIKEKDVQIDEKSRIIKDLMPRALPKPKMGIGEKIKSLFRREGQE